MEDEPGRPQEDDELTIPRSALLSCICFSAWVFFAAMVDMTIPRAAMNKMIKELLPNIRVANEARELVLTCCTEFIHLISSESNDICNQQQKKTISAEHVLAALEKLGYGDFRKDAEEVLTECKETAAKRRRQSTRLENLGIPEEELLRQQQELFARAREAAVQQEQGGDGGQEGAEG